MDNGQTGLNLEKYVFKGLFKEKYFFRDFFERTFQDKNCGFFKNIYFKNFFYEKYIFGEFWNDIFKDCIRDFIKNIFKDLLIQRTCLRILMAKHGAFFKNIFSKGFFLKKKIYFQEFFRKEIFKGKKVDFSKKKLFKNSEFLSNDICKECIIGFFKHIFKDLLMKYEFSRFHFIQRTF